MSLACLSLPLYRPILCAAKVPAVADGTQDDDPHAAVAALESSFPDLKRNKQKKKGGQAAAAMPGLVEAGTLCTLLCPTH